MFNKKPISKLNLAFGIIIIVTTLIAFLGEILSIQMYQNSAPENNAIGLGVILIIWFAMYCGIPLVLIGVYNIVAGSICGKTESVKTFKTLSIISVVTQILSSIAFAFYFLLVIDLYPAGIILKAIYLLTIIFGLVVAILNVVSLCKKVKPVEEFTTVIEE